MIQYKRNHIKVFQSALFQTTSAVIETVDLVLVVDPTWLPHEVEEIRDDVVNIRNGRPLYMLFTHSDYDHILGYKAFPDAITIGSKELSDNQNKVRIVEQIKAFDDKYYLKRDYEIVYPKIHYIVDKDGQQLQVGETVVTFYKAPGHTEDGIFAIVQPLGVFIAGDYLSNIEFPYIYHDSKAYENTLSKVDYILENHSIRLLVPGHGQVTEDIQEIKHRQEESLSYIRGLKEAIRKDNQVEVDKLIKGCLFPRFMKKAHTENQIKIIKEVEK
jgi:hydroxyacylglutathione hydrolase